MLDFDWMFWAFVVSVGACCLMVFWLVAETLSAFTKRNEHSQTDFSGDA